MLISFQSDNFLDKNFYKQSTPLVALELIGKIIVRKINGELLTGRIVETEAYLGADDPACHSFVGKTKRNAGMFEDAGLIYVYRSYGLHNCTNFVTEDIGIGAAVLIRAVEPLSGIPLMQKYRGIDDLKILCKGPGNFSKAFNFLLEDNLNSLLTENLFVAKNDRIDDEKIKITSRIGITRGLELPLRFFEKDNKFVSAKKS